MAKCKPDMNKVKVDCAPISAVRVNGIKERYKRGET